MASELKDRLTDLADHTPSGTPPPGDLWSRGVRRRRVSQVGRSVLVAALVLILGVGAWSWQTSRQELQPVAPHGTPHVPDQVFPPSPWTRAFGGPPGRLLAVTPATRNRFWHLGSMGMVGITASAGEYGFLDLPDAADPSLSVFGDLQPALSPDGRYVAYWVIGRPSSTPNTVQLGQTVVGVRVYDAVTGHLRSADLASPHGISPQALLWTDSRTLALDFGQITGADGSVTSSMAVHDYRLEAWRLGAPRPVRMTSPALESVADGQFSTPGNGWLVAWASGTRLVDLRHPERVLRASADPGTGGVLAVSPDLSRVARVTGRGGPAHLQVGRLHVVAAGHAKPTRFRAVVSSGRSSWPMVWTGSHELVVVGPSTAGNDGAAALNSIDLRTGTTTTLVSGVTSSGAASTVQVFASDLLSAPRVHAERPRVWNPHTRLALLLGALLALLAGAAVWWRRRA